jgi:hypothetical protein
MKYGKLGMMNIDFEETYDKEDDTYYVTFKTGEPSYCVEIDDKIVLEVGLFTNLPTGFRVLNFRRSKLKRVEFKKQLKQAIKDVYQEKSGSAFQQREALMGRALDKVLA